MLAAIVVTHNSQRVLPRCLEALQNQTHPVDRIILVDSGSEDRSYLGAYADDSSVRLLLADNIGFSAANNLGARHLPAASEFILVLNPDTFLDRDFVACALETMQQYPAAGVVTSKLLHYDLESGHPSARFDSTGIFRNWYGRWHDRGQGEDDRGQYDRIEEVPAVCGALMFCRRSAVEDVSLPEGAIFDPDFFMYKEDIEFCLRLRKKGWRIVYQPACIAWHCRGWGSRRNISRRFRKMAAGNEILLYRKHPSPYMVWALVKNVLVNLFNA